MDKLSAPELLAMAMEKGMPSSLAHEILEQRGQDALEQEIKDLKNSKSEPE